MAAMNPENVMARRSAPWPSSWITTPGGARLVMTNTCPLAGGKARRGNLGRACESGIRRPASLLALRKRPQAGCLPRPDCAEFVFCKHALAGLLRRYASRNDSPNITGRWYDSSRRPTNPSPDEVLQRREIFFLGSCNHVGGQPGARRLLIPFDCEQVIADKLFVERSLRVAGFIRTRLPKTG